MTIGESTGAAFMDCERDAAYRLKLGEGFFEEAEQDFNLSRWRSCVDNSQLCVENSAKAVIARYVPVPRTHNVTGPLEELRKSAKISPEVAEKISILKQCADLLGYDEHIHSDYGEEATFRTPWELFDKEDAERSLDIAKRALQLAKEILQIPHGSSDCGSPL